MDPHSSPRATQASLIPTLRAHVIPPKPQGFFFSFDLLLFDALQVATDQMQKRGEVHMAFLGSAFHALHGTGFHRRSPSFLQGIVEVVPILCMLQWDAWSREPIEEPGTQPC